jgi:hypothetical protein
MLKSLSAAEHGTLVPENMTTYGKLPQTLVPYSSTYSLSLRN